MQIANGFTLTENESQEIAMSLISLDFETVLYSDKIFQVSQTPQGRKDSFKMICGLLTFFSQATKVKQQLTNAETIMISDWIMKTYTHESLEDIALALKGAIFGEYKFYGAVTISSVREIIFNYFEHKAINLEKVHKNTVNDPSTFTHNPVIQQLLHKNTDHVDNYVSFVEVFDKEKRANVAKRYAEILARLPEIREKQAYFKAVEDGLIPAYEIENNEQYRKSCEESAKILKKIQADDEKKYGWFKQ